MSECHVTACIDGSVYSQSVCDAAVWAGRALDAPLTFVHTIDPTPPVARVDASGRIGLGSREHLLAELADLDAQRARLSHEQGRVMLEAACARVREQGVTEVHTRQRHGALADTLVEREDDIRLLVLGKRGETAETAHEHLGSNLERVIRALHCPMLIVPADFKPPQRVAVAFDASPTGRAMIDRLSQSPLFESAACDLVYVGTVDDDRQRELDAAKVALERAFASVACAVLEGEVESALRRYKQANAIDMLVMGAYGHSRIRHLLVGSTTTQMIRHARRPVLILR